MVHQPFQELIEGVLEKSFSHSLFIVSICILLIHSETLKSQSVINGKVLGKNGIALQGASIIIVDTGEGTLTDLEGLFTLRANPGDLVECSYLGYSPFQFIVGTEDTITIPMSEAIMMLDELVVIGYGTATRKDVSGSVARINREDFVGGRISDPLEQIQGKIAGVVIQQPGGDPNGELSIRIRGATSLEGQPPLLVIDGVAIDDFYRALNALNPSDIASYDVLKDASAAAIYGSRGANGVILITTKTGEAGNTKIDYHGYTTLETVANNLDLLDATQFREVIAPLNLMGVDQGADTDWQKAITRSGYLSSHAVAISGGTESLKYRGSVGYLKNEGVILNNGRESVNSRLNVTQKALNNKLNITYGINTTWTNRNFLSDQSSTSLTRTGGSSIFGIAASYLPVWPIFNEDGSYYEPPVIASNPLFTLTENLSEQKEFFFQTSAKADYEVIDGLKVGFVGAVTQTNDTYDSFNPTPPGTNILSRASKSNVGKQILTGDLHFNFQKRFSKHKIDFTGVYEYNRFINDGFAVTAEGFLIPELLNNNLGTASTILTDGISSFKNEVRLISFLSRAVYNYDDRYIVTANFRRDGSSKFGPNNRWGSFPSFAVAWQMSNEEFLQQQTWLNLKLRMSYGFTGNQENLLPNQYQTLYEPAGPYLYNGQFLQSYGVIQESNPDLRWEQRRSFNIGLDFSLWGDRVTGTIDVFNDKTEDLLFNYDIPQPPFLTNQVVANAASASNKGVELSLGANVISNNSFRWSLYGNLATIRNKVTDLLGSFKGVPLALNDRSYGFARAPSVAGAGPVTRLQVGYPAGVFYIPEFAGLDDAGNELFNNYDSDGVFVGSSNSYSEQDLVFIDPTPNYNWGLTSNFFYQDFELSFFLRGVRGQKIFSNSLLSRGALNYLPNTNLAVSEVSNGFAGNPFPSTYWLRDGSFTRLENLTLAYQFKKLKTLDQLRIYITGTNLFVITNYAGVDPEIRTEGSQRYIDSAFYPTTRGYTIGLEVTF